MNVIEKLIEQVRRSPRIAAAGLFILAGLGVAVYFLVRPDDGKQKDFRNVAVEVEEVRVGSLTRTLTAVGTLNANQTITIRPEVNGLVSKIHVEGGEMIERDSPLFEIDDRVYRAELKEAEARLAFARVEHNRAQLLAEKKFGSAQKLDDAQAKLLMAEAAVESAKAKLERTVIRAPFDGIIGLHNVAIGSSIGPDKEITTLVDITPMKVDFKIPAEYLRYISMGQNVEIKVDGFGEKKHTGIIAGIDSRVDTMAHSINVRALMPNKQNIFKPGLFARVDVVVGSRDNTMIIPDVALEASGDRETVYKVVEGLAFQVPVMTGMREGENIEILRGLNPGDHIVVVGQSKIRDGTPVRYELNGQTYAFDEVTFKKKQQEMEEKKKEAEAASSPVATDEGSATASTSEEAVSSTAAEKNSGGVSADVADITEKGASDSGSDVPDKVEKTANPESLAPETTDAGAVEVKNGTDQDKNIAEKK